MYDVVITTSRCSRVQETETGLVSGILPLGAGEGMAAGRSGRGREGKKGEKHNWP